MLFGEGEQPPFPILSRYPFLFSALLRWVVVFGTAFRVAYSSLRWGVGLRQSLGGASPDLSGLFTGHYSHTVA